MGNPRPRPEHLSAKLRQIRLALGLSQTQMLSRLGLKDMKAGRISQYENNEREPTLQTLLAYSRAACIYMEDIVDDDLELPAQLPGDVRPRRKR